MARIPTYTDLDASSVTNPANIRLFAADIQGANPGLSRSAGLDDVSYLATSELINSSGHGLVAADEGKPLFGVAVLDDTEEGERAHWVLLDRLDTSNIRVLRPGGSIDIPLTMLEGGSGYDVSTSGRSLWWDESATQYVPSPPGDTTTGVVLELISVGSTTFRAVFAARDKDDAPGSALQVTVKGTGSTTDDNTLLTAARDALNATTSGGTLLIDGTVRVSTHIAFTKAVSIKGIHGTSPQLLYMETAGHFSWNGSYAGITDAQSGTSISASAGDSHLMVPTGTLEAGDWFLVVADDAITGVTIASGVAGHRPLEMHQCKEVRDTSGGEDMIVFDDYFVDDYTTNAKVKKIDVLDGIEVSGLSLGWSGSEGVGNQPTGPALDFRKCVNVRCHDLHWLTNGPNEMIFLYCANSIVRNVIMETPRAYDTGDGYALAVGVCNNFIWADSVAYGSRHVFTTTNQSDSNDYRYGTPRNVLVSNVVAKLNGTDVGQGSGGNASGSGSSLVAFDTHEGGWNVVFSGCTVSLPFDPRDYAASVENPNRAFQSRSRRTVFRDCTVDASASTNGFLLLSEGNIVKDCTMVGGWKCVEIKYDTSGGTTNGCDNNVVANLEFAPGTNTSAQMVSVSAGDDITITNSSMIAGAVPGRYGVVVTDSGDDAPTVGLHHCSFSKLYGEAISVAANCTVRVSHCDFDDIGSHASFEQSAIHLTGAPTLSLFSSTLPKGSNVYSVSGTSFGAGDVSIIGNVMTGYSGSGTTTTDSGFDSVNLSAGALHTAVTDKNWLD